MNTESPNKANDQTATDSEALHLLGELLVQIRGIAGDAANCGHVSSLGCERFSPEDACKAIYELADAAHNLPEAIIDPRKGFLLDSSMKRIVSVSTKVFGEKSRMVWR